MIGLHRPGGPSPSLRYGHEGIIPQSHLLTHVQDVIYEDKAQVDKVLAKLRRLPPLVSPVEVPKAAPTSIMLIQL